MNEIKSETKTDERRKKPRRAEIQLYIPAPLRHLRQSALNDSAQTKTGIVVDKNTPISRGKSIFAPKINSEVHKFVRPTSNYDNTKKDKKISINCEEHKLDRSISKYDNETKDKNLSIKSDYRNPSTNIKSVKYINEKPAQCGLGKSRRKEHLTKSDNNKPSQTSYDSIRDVRDVKKSNYDKSFVNNFDNVKAVVNKADNHDKISRTNRPGKGMNMSVKHQYDWTLRNNGDFVIEDANKSIENIRNCKNITEGKVNKSSEKINTATSNINKNTSVWKRELVKGNFLNEKKYHVSETDKVCQRNTQNMKQDKSLCNNGHRLCLKEEKFPRNTFDHIKGKATDTDQNDCNNLRESDIQISPQNLETDIKNPVSVESSGTYVIYNSSKHSSAKINNLKSSEDIYTEQLNIDSSEMHKDQKKSDTLLDAQSASSELCPNLDYKRAERQSDSDNNIVLNPVKIAKSPTEEHSFSEKSYSQNKFRSRTKNTAYEDSSKHHKVSQDAKKTEDICEKTKTFPYNEQINQLKSYYSSNSDEDNITDKKTYLNSSSKKVIDSGNSKQVVTKSRRKKIPISGLEEKSDNQINRGLIHLPTVSSSNNKIEAAPNIPQKLLYNPNNPSKPVFVTASPRDLVNCTDKMSISEPSKEWETHKKPTTIDNHETTPIDPSMLLHSLHKGEMDILYYLNTNQLPQEFRRIMDIRFHLQTCYEKLLLNEMRLCHEKNIENSQWKSLYYLIIEKLREYILRDPSLRERSVATLHMLVNEGLQYFPLLISKLEKAYKFSLDDHFKQDLTIQQGVKNRVKLAIHSCQKLLLALGDLSRYKEQYSSNPNLSSAKKWYLTALQVQPRNGRPFNQLAIIAVNERRALDVVYYYIRSLTAANPFVSARDSLISMFDDIRKKYESMNSSSKCTPEKQSLSEMSSYSRKNTSEDMREETWIRPDSGITNQRTLSQSEFDDSRNTRLQELLKLPPDQQMKRFLISYLHCHGMLFSRVGLDCFNEALENTLDLFHVLLQSGCSILSAVHLIQIVAVNIYAIENTQMKESLHENNYRSAAQEFALLLAQEMFGKLCETVVKLLPKYLNSVKMEGVDGLYESSHPFDSHPEESGSIELLSDNYNIMTSDPQKVFLSEVFSYIPAIKIWCDWLLYHSAQWNPPAQSHEILPSNNSWHSVAALSTLMKRVGPPDVCISDVPTDDSINVILPEDNYLKGYSLLLPAVRDLGYISSSTNMERARDWLRLNKIKLCLTQFLCGVEPPILRLQKTDQGEILVPILSVDLLEKLDSDNTQAKGASSEEAFSEVDTTLSDDDLSVTEVETAQIDSMTTFFIQKDIIEKRERRQKKQQDRMAITLQMEIRPRVLVPDTNCFIKDLNLIEKIVKSTSYEVMVPLVVIGELEALSRNTAVEKYGDAAHAVTVREGAASGLHFLRSTLNKEHCRNLKCVTSQGSILTSATFTDEIGDQGMTNDDRILCCCMHFFKDNNVRRPITEGVRRLYREVVLLTDDRHLRVRAYSKDVPVRNLIDFAHWAGIK